MSGTREGGLKAAKKNGKAHYQRIALLSQEAWDRNGRKPRGFSDRELARRAGAIGGKMRRKHG